MNGGGPPSLAMHEPPGSEEFVFGSLVAADRYLKRAVLALTVAIIVGIGLETLVVGWQELPDFQRLGLSNTNVQLSLVALVISGGTVASLCVMLPRVLPGALSLRVDDLGVHLHYGRRTSDMFAWTGSSGFRILDNSAFPDLVAFGSGFMLYGPHVWYRRTLITREAAEAILARARLKGNRVTRSIGNPAWYGRPTVIHQIRAGHERRGS